MQLGMGFILVKFVVMQKRMKLLHYILNENINSLIRQVFEALREDSRKEDFVFLNNKDRIYLKIDQTDEEISEMSKHKCKNHIKDMVRLAALKSLVKENYSKEKTRDIYSLKHLKLVNS